MDDDLFKHAKELFLAVCDLSLEERSAALDLGCGEDTELRAEVESLLRHHDADVTTSEIAPDGGSEAPEAPESVAVRSVGPYRVIREIGRGGMGVVYVGVKEGDQFKRRVAIKVLKRGTDTESVLHRFELERQVLSAMNHQGIARLFEAGETEDGVPYFAMEYVEGLPINEYCDIHRLHIDERIELFSKVCSAVHYAHQNLVVHRDLKPSNIIVTKEGQPKLLDFGIAKLTNPEMSLVTGDLTAPEFRVMTPEYASPEQVRGNPITTASDVYSLGVLLYELVSGHRPYRLRSRVRAEMERVICEEEPEKPSTAISRVEEPDSSDPTTTKSVTPESVSRTREGHIDRLRKRLAGDIDNIVLMAMRKEPQRRYSSADELAADLRRHLEGMPVRAHRDTLGYRTAKFVRRNWAGVAAVAIIAVALVIAVAGASWGWRTSHVAKQAEVALREEAEAAREQAAAQRAIAIAERDQVLLLRSRMGTLFGSNLELLHSYLDTFEKQLTLLVGSTSARETLVNSALANLQDIRNEIGDDPAILRELALAYERIGDVTGGIRTPSRGDSEQAGESYRIALSIRQELADESPDDLTLQSELSTSHMKLGDTKINLADVAGALESYGESLRICKELEAKDPSSSERRRNLAVALSNYGHALLRNSEVEAAVRHYKQSMALREELAGEHADDPDIQRDLSLIYRRIGNRLDMEGEHEAAIEMFINSVRICETLVQMDPDNGRWQRDLAFANVFLGRSYLTLGEIEIAVGYFDEHLRFMEERTTADPDDLSAKRDLANAHEMIGRGYSASREWDLAGSQFQACRAEITPLIEEHPENTQYRNTLGSALKGLAKVLAGSGDIHGAIEKARESLEVSRGLHDSDPTDPRWQIRVAYDYLQLGTYLAQAGETEEARESLNEADARYSSLAEDQPSDAVVRAGRVLALHELSKLSAAMNDGAAAFDFAQQAFETAEEPSARLMRDLAFAYSLTGDDVRAAEVAVEALELLADEEDAESADLRRILEEDVRRYQDQ